jgi:NADH:ubiquinone oxidoreductase subunit 5 (subunit L)/multisubunit Na+/H+ antiporter MnhA subunit
MPDFSGPIQALELAHWLWLIPLCPLLGALANALVTTGLLRSFVQTFSHGFAEDDSPVPLLDPIPRSAKTSGRIAVASLSAGFVLALAYVIDLLSADPGRRTLVEHGWQLLRVGQLDVGADLTLDPLSATFLLVATGATTLWAVQASSEEHADDARSARFFALFCALAAGLTLAILAEDLGLLLFAWGWVGLASAFLLRSGADEKRRVLRAIATHRAGDAAVLAGAALLFWSFGGGWTDAGYVSDLEARVQAVSLDNGDGSLQKSTGSTVGKGSLTVAALPGSLVYPDDSRTPLLGDTGLPLRTPFVRHQMAGGAHSFRVAPDDTFRVVGDATKTRYVVEGGVLTNYSVPRIAMGEGREVSLSVVGPTLRFREMRDQLVAKDSRGTAHLSDLLAHRALLGTRSSSALGLACFLLLVGACVKSAQLPLHGWLLPSGQAAPAGGGVVQSVALAMGVYLVARLGFVFSLAPSVLLVTALVGVVTAIYAAFAAAFQYDLGRVLAFASIYQLGLAFVALGSEAYVVAILMVITHAVTVSCLLVARASIPEKQSDLRTTGALTAGVRAIGAYRVAVIALTAVPVPLFAGFWPLAGALGAPFATYAVPRWLAVGIYGGVAVAAGLASFALWRSYWLVFGGPRKGAAKRRARKTTDRLLSSLVLLSVAVGAVLGLSPRWLGGEAVSLLEAWLDPLFSMEAKQRHVSAELRIGLVSIGIALAFAGWAIARQRYGEGRPKDWQDREGALPGAELGARLR